MTDFSIIENLSENQLIELYNENIIQSTESNFLSDLYCTVNGSCICVGYGWSRGDEAKCKTVAQSIYPGSRVACTWGSPDRACDSRGYCRDVLRGNCIPS